MQDWDRALVVSQTTFGKGLVQRQYRLKNGAALLLTVARYYTPSGRLIQRDYSDRDAYLSAEFDEDFEEGIEAEAEADSAREEYRTAGNRTVFGGGGITPDIHVDLAYPSAEITNELGADRAFFDFATQYTANHQLAKGGEVHRVLAQLRHRRGGMSEFKSFSIAKRSECADSLAAHRR
jgi:carboxyl-terminal processing protease